MRSRATDAPVLSFALATPADASTLVALRTATARDLTARFGEGHWSGEPTERGVTAIMRHAQVWLAHLGAEPVAMFRLATKKPWAIDVSYFTPAVRPLYLTDMAVLPSRQREGVGRACLAEAERIAHAWPADAIRLDAYDAPAGAGGFYARCGFSEMGRASYRGTPLVYFERRL